MKSRKHIPALILFAFASVLIPTVFAQDQVSTAIYSDVDLGHPEYVAIKYLSEKGVIKGYEDGSFKPSNLINRAEALKIILEANGLVTPEYIEENSPGGINFDSEPLPFSDVYKSLWYYPYLKKALEKEIINGYPDGTFKPERTVNRVESFKMTMESDDVILPEVTENPFADVSKDDWFAPYMLEAKIREIIYITMQNTVNPSKEMTRSQFSELVYRYLKSKEGCRFGKASYYSDYFEGRSTTSGEPYIAAELTAAHLTLPFGTIVKVTNLANGNSVEVRINDRGPHVTGRSIDLSKAAFESIAHLGSGIIYVEYEVITQQQ